MNRRGFVGRALAAIGAVVGIGSGAKAVAKPSERDDLMAMLMKVPLDGDGCQHSLIATQRYGEGQKLIGYEIDFMGMISGRGLTEEQAEANIREKTKGKNLAYVYVSKTPNADIVMYRFKLLLPLSKAV